MGKEKRNWKGWGCTLKAAGVEGGAPTTPGTAGARGGNSYTNPKKAITASVGGGCRQDWGTLVKGPATQQPGQSRVQSRVGGGSRIYLKEVENTQPGRCPSSFLVLPALPFIVCITEHESHSTAHWDSRQLRHTVKEHLQIQNQK